MKLTTRQEAGEIGIVGNGNNRMQSEMLMNSKVILQEWSQNSLMILAENLVED